MNAHWLVIREKLQKTLQSGTFKVWIAPLYGEVESMQVRLTAPNGFVADWVRDRLSDDISAAAAAVLGGPVTVCITVGSHDAVPTAAQLPVQALPATPVALALPGLDATPATCLEQPLPVRLLAQATARLHPTHLYPAHPDVALSAPATRPPLQAQSRPAADVRAQVPLFSATEQLGLPYMPTPRVHEQSWRYTFDGFVVGPGNELAHAAARSMTRDTAAVDTLFLSSGSGLGKTHLSQAVGQALCQSSNRSHMRVEYLTAEEFSSCFVQAMKAREIERFKSRFREVDMLLLEDVEFLQNKEKMQDEVLSTIKTLQSRGSRVVLTSSFAPRDLRNLDNQLVSRFCSGFLAGIEKPDLATRRRILIEKATAQQTVLPDSVADLLAERVSTDVRRLESCLCNLILKARLLGRDICVDLARDILTQYTQDIPLPDLDSIIERVCAGFGLSAPQLTSRSRRQHFVVARNTIFFLARKHTDLSLQEIGDRFGRRHSTVIKGIASIERELKRETPLGRQVAAALARIEAH